jgi:hypothetical protein
MKGWPVYPDKSQEMLGSKYCIRSDEILGRYLMFSLMIFNYKTYKSFYFILDPLCGFPAPGL